MWYLFGYTLHTYMEFGKDNAMKGRLKIFSLLNIHYGFLKKYFYLVNIMHCCSINDDIDNIESQNIHKT